MKLNVPFFSNYDGTVLNNICDKLTKKVFQRDEIIVLKGDIGDCMYTVLLGEVGVYFDD